jgi:zinc finger FYVE domain-containing protein 1
MFSLIQVLSGHQSPPLQPGVASPALAADSAGAGQGAASGVVTGKACGTGERGGGYSVLQVLTDKDEVCVKTCDEFLAKLACPPQARVKVVSIYGNTGDGKSHTLNQTLFDGCDVFATSASQSSCTCGAWLALQPRTNTLVIDTEGMLAVSDNENARKRLLLKVLALSDVVIYVTRAERLHQDMFAFLEDASAAYCKYFQQELETAATRTSNSAVISSVGPALVLFHETRNTDVLEADINAHLIDRFSAAANKTMRSFPLAYSDVVYVGQRKRDARATDFEPLRQAVSNLLSHNSVRVPRAPAVVFEQLMALNRKFTGDLDASFVGDILPDLLFRCPHVCSPPEHLTWASLHVCEIAWV